MVQLKVLSNAMRTAPHDGMNGMMQRVIALVLSTTLLSILATPCQAESPPESVIAAQRSRQASMAKASQATIAVFGLDGGGGGSGVIITPDGYALTNFHVTSACGDHMRCGLSDGRMVDAVIVGIDATGDVSLIKLLGSDDFPTAPLADSDQVRVGQWCFAAGNPFGLATNLQPTISLGVVSGTGRYQYPAGTLLEYSDCIQTDAAINPGNSGGPLFNLDAEVIGINGRCSFEKRGRVNVGVGYAISINQIKNFLGMLRSGRLVDHATLGATVATDESGKVLISNLLSGSDAYRRGLRYGDQLISFAGREINTTNDFKNVLGTLPKDWRVPMTIKREGKSETLLVRLMGVHTEGILAKLVAGESAEDPRKEKPSEKRRGKRPGDKNPEDKPKDGKPEEGKPGDKHQHDEDDKLSKAAERKAEEAADDSPAPGRPDFKLVKSMLERREGFANYYFNRLERQQVWARIQKLGDFSKGLDRRWEFSGKLGGETTASSLSISPAMGKVQVGRRAVESLLTDELAALVDKNQEEGLLVAMRAWQQLLQEGPERLGSTMYLGTAPIYPTLNSNEMLICDCLQADWYDCMVRFYVPVGSNEIRAIEVTGDNTTDPVEVILDAYQEIDGRKWPGRARLQYGTEPRFVLTFEKIDDLPDGAQDGTQGEAIQPQNPNAKDAK